MAHFTTDLPDWKTWRNLNENKELAEDKAIELYKKLYHLEHQSANYKSFVFS